MGIIDSADEFTGMVKAKLGKNTDYIDLYDLEKMMALNNKIKSQFIEFLRRMQKENTSTLLSFDMQISSERRRHLLNAVTLTQGLARSKGQKVLNAYLEEQQSGRALQPLKIRKRVGMPYAPPQVQRGVNRGLLKRSATTIRPPFLTAVQSPTAADFGMIKHRSPKGMSRQYSEASYQTLSMSRTSSTPRD